MFEQFIENLKNIFSRNSAGIQSGQSSLPSSSSRRFRIARRKKFDVGQINNNPSHPSSTLDGPMRIESQTRPKICPMCQTEDKITSLSSRQWKCTVCEYTWHS
jgi:hypothetical protein